MSFFNKILASVGIGNTKVDTQLASDRLIPGSEINGIVTIKGGNVDQQVGKIYFSLMTQYIQERDNHKFIKNAVIASYQLSEGIHVEANSSYEIPFSIRLPLETPSSIGRTPIWIQTGLDIQMAVDPQDRDYIEVLPHPYVATMLKALENLGFQLRKTQNEYTGRWGRSLPFIQEYEFVPTGLFRKHLDELEFIFFPKEDGLEFVVEIDRRARGLSGLFAEALDMDETKHRLFIPAEELSRGMNEVAPKLKSYLSSMI